MDTITLERIAEIRELLGRAFEWPPSNLDRFVEDAEGWLPPLLDLAERVLRAEVACHRTVTGNKERWGWVDGEPSQGALDNLRVHPQWRIEGATYTRDLAYWPKRTPPTSEGEK